MSKTKIFSFTAFCITTVMMMALVGCSEIAEPEGGWQNPPSDESRQPKTSSASNDDSKTEQDANEAEENETKSLVIYFSVPDNKDNSYVEKDGEKLGNTQYVAYVIQDNTGSDIFRILPKDPYPTDHEALLERAQQEISENARPEIENEIENFDSYDTVFVGYPNWNADMPYIMYTLFETYDFSGKKIIPFNTHGGSGFSGAPEIIAELEPQAEALDGISIYRDDVADSEQQIIDWLDELGLKK